MSSFFQFTKTHIRKIFLTYQSKGQSAEHVGKFSPPVPRQIFEMESEP